MSRCEAGSLARFERERAPEPTVSDFIFVIISFADDMDPTFDAIEAAARTVGIEARINASDGNPDEWVRQTEEWRKLGATHISINTMNAGFKSPAEHIDAIRRYKEAVGK